MRRITLRRAMLLVAILGISFGIARMMEVRKVRLREAAAHKDFRDLVTATPDSVTYWEMRWTDQRAGKPASYPWPASPPFVPAIAAYHDAMRAKWERGARYPWLPVQPDPPEPR